MQNKIYELYQKHTKNGLRFLILETGGENIEYE